MKEQLIESKKSGDYDIWYKPCIKCGNHIARDYSERALKKQ